MATVRRTMLATMLLAALVQSATATTYIVGDDVGWTIPPSTSPTFFDDWAANKMFVVGDKLTFTYATGHNVYQVSADDAKNCDGTNPIAIFEAANPTILLTDTGDINYICEITGHCGIGMKMTLTVFPNGTLPSDTNKAKSPTLPPIISPRAPPPSAAPGFRSTAAMMVGSFLAAGTALVL